MAAKRVSEEKVDKYAARHRETANLHIYARAAKRAIVQIDGVKRARFRFRQWLRRASGVTIAINERGRFHAEVAIVVRYGANVREVGARVQQAVVDAVRRFSARPIGRINVTITGVALSRRDLKEGTAKGRV